MKKRPFSIDPSATAAFDRIKDNIFDSSFDIWGSRYERLKAVVIGGGTGAPMSIKTLLSMNIKTSSVVAMADDGGSTGMLRQEAGVTPPGDVRKCIAAYASNPHDPLTRAFKYRFEFADNHTLGNLMLSALEDACGSFPAAIDICEQLLHARGHVYPSTLDKVELAARTASGVLLEGQANASHAPEHLSHVWLKDVARVKAYEAALASIREADLIVLGPGSLFTSIIPNLLVPGVVEAIDQSEGKTLFVCSLADVQGETLGMSAKEHVEALLNHGMRGRLDYVLAHTPCALSETSPQVGASSTLSCDGPSGIAPVNLSYSDALSIEDMGPELIVRNLVDTKRPTWHNPEALRDAFTCVIKLMHKRKS